MYIYIIIMHVTTCSFISRLLVINRSNYYNFLCTVVASPWMQLLLISLLLTISHLSFSTKRVNWTEFDSTCLTLHFFFLNILIFIFSHLPFFSSSSPSYSSASSSSSSCPSSFVFFYSQHFFPILFIIHMYTRDPSDKINRSTERFISQSRYSISINT